MLVCLIVFLKSKMKYIMVHFYQVAVAIGQSTVDPRSKEVLLETLLEQRNLLEFVLDKRKFYKLTVKGEPTAKIDDVDKGYRVFNNDTSNQAHGF